MKLINWINKNGYTQRQVAKKLRITPSRLCRICRTYKPSLTEVMAMEKMTNHQVTMEDFIKQIKERENGKNNND